ncbi:MAG: DEAD/DEAH box helicase, partial [Paracoccaceae bacterium]
MKKALADALTQRGYETLTPVQKAVTEAQLQNADLLVSAQTGSGKTVGFGLALGETLLGTQDNFGSAEAPLALIIAPTRELALQVKRELAWLYAPAGVVMASCVGGMDMRDERRALGRGAHIVVATPGRLRDHIMRGSIDLSAVRGVVLDEADEMLDLGFREDLEFILGEAPDDRRTLMFSATVPKAIATLAKSYQRDAVRVTTVAETKPHNDIKYHAMTVANHDAENAIINILRFYEAPNAIVFCNTRAMVNRVTTRLSNRNFSVVALSGELSQAERSHALQAMRDGRARVCVATDVAARGIDLPGLDLVVHAELPNNHETLLHRSGRTGRAGRKGESCLIVTAKLRRKAERILQAAKLVAEWGEAPSAEAVRQRDQERLLADQMWNDPIAASEEEMVDRLAEKFDLKQLAAAYLRLYNQRVSAPEELSMPGEARAAKPAAPFGPSKWFSINQGRNQAAEVRRLLPILCNAGDITKDDIGAIRIQNDETFVEISQQAVAGFTQALGADMKIEGGLVVSALN